MLFGYLRMNPTFRLVAGGAQDLEFQPGKQFRHLNTDRRGRAQFF